MLVTIEMLKSKNMQITILKRKKIKNRYTLESI